jgi:hypothetical protein
MRGSREDTEQELKRRQDKRNGVQTEAGGGATIAEDGHSTDER